MVDAHVHLYPDLINRDPSGWAAAAGERHWATLCTRRRKGGQPVQGFPRVDELLRQMDTAGVEHALLVAWYWEHLESCRLQNRFYAACVRAHPDRLSAFACVHPDEGAAAALDELDWARGHGLCGVGELSPHSVGWPLDDPTLAAVLARAGEWGWPVNLHVTEPDSRPFPGKVETPLGDFVALAAAHPRTRFILAHFGGGLGVLPLFAGRCEAQGHLRSQTEAARQDTPLPAAPPLLPNLYFDTAAAPLIYGKRAPQVLRDFVAAVGAERVLWGSDYPLNLYPAQAAAPELRGFADVLREGAGLTASEIRAIGGDNARSLLGLA